MADFDYRVMAGNAMDCLAGGYPYLHHLSELGLGQGSALGADFKATATGDQSHPLSLLDHDRCTHQVESQRLASGQRCGRIAPDHL
jgi:hypothetical protein